MKAPPWKHPLDPVPNFRCIIVPLEIERLTDQEREERLRKVLQDLDTQRKDAQ